MRFPEYLNKGETIGFAAPSCGCATEPYASCFDAALERFTSLGYKIKEGPNCRLDLGVGKSNTPQACAEELTQMYCSSDNQAIISCGGGETMCEDLDYIDFERIARAKPKWYMGYSDNTNFTFTLTTMCDTASIYGPCAAAFGMKPWHTSLADALSVIDGGRTAKIGAEAVAKKEMHIGAKAVMDAGIDLAAQAQVEQDKVTVYSYGAWQRRSLKTPETPYVPYFLTDETKILSFGADGTERDVNFSGRLIGGCMDCLIGLIGTEFDHVKEFSEKYAEDGIIWYLEACDLSVMDMRRAVWHMMHAGWFRHARGFIIGKPMLFGFMMMGLNEYDAVKEPLSTLGVPIIMDANIGHVPPMMPLINGSLATAQTENGKLKLEMRLI